MNIALKCGHAAPSTSRCAGSFALPRRKFTSQSAPSRRRRWNFSAMEFWNVRSVKKYVWSAFSLFRSVWMSHGNGGLLSAILVRFLLRFSGASDWLNAEDWNPHGELEPARRTGTHTGIAMHFGIPVCFAWNNWSCRRFSASYAQLSSWTFEIDGAWDEHDREGKWEGWEGLLPPTPPPLPTRSSSLAPILSWPQWGCCMLSERAPPMARNGSVLMATKTPGHSVISKAPGNISATFAKIKHCRCGQAQMGIMGR